MRQVHPAKALSFPELLAGLRSEVAAGNVTETQDGTLSLFCYSKSCVYERAWGPISTLARGVVVDVEAGRVVATPFPKFFNVGENAVTLPAEPFEAFEKLDGSLIVAFYHDGRWRAATKGAFRSTQAQWAESRLPEGMIPGVTYLFEAIYPENVIVIQYPPSSYGLWLLAAYDEDGAELSYEDLSHVSRRLKVRLVSRIAFESVADMLERAGRLPASEEGWVVRFQSGLRLKIKGDAYLAIHRAVSKLSPLSVWDALAAGGGLATEMRAALPEEFWPDFDDIRSRLEAQYQSSETTLRMALARVGDMDDKSLGLQLQAGDFKELGPLAGLMFTARKQPDRVPAKLWGLLRPDGNRLEGYRPGAAVARVQDEAA